MTWSRLVLVLQRGLLALDRWENNNNSNLHNSLANPSVLDVCHTWRHGMVTTWNDDRHENDIETSFYTTCSSFQVIIISIVCCWGLLDRVVLWTCLWQCLWSRKNFRNEYTHGQSWTTEFFGSFRRWDFKFSRKIRLLSGDCYSQLVIQIGI